MKITVRLSHLDDTGQLSLGILLSFMQDCSHEQYMSNKALVGFLKEHNVGVFISSRQIEINRLPSLGERIEIISNFYKSTPMYNHWNVLIYNDRKELLIASNVIGFYVDLKHLHVTRIHEEMQTMITLCEPFNMTYLPRKIDIPANIKPEVMRSVYIWRHYLDVNNHVNNAQYLTLAQEFLPRGYTPKRIRAEYMHAAHYGDVIHPHVYKTNDSYIVILKSETGKRYSIFEFR